MDFIPPKELVFDKDLVRNFRTFKLDLEIYFVATETTKKSQEVQVARLLNLIGAEGRRKVQSLDLPTPRTVEAILRALEQECIPEKNEVMAHFNFFRRSQRVGESFDHFYRDLKELVVFCDFGQVERALLRTQIVLGIADKGLQTKLLRANKDLSMTVSICQAHEAGVKYGQLVQSDVINEAVPVEECRRDQHQREVKEENLSEDERCQITECNQVIKTEHYNIAVELKEENLSEDERCQIAECNQVFKTEYDNIAVEVKEEILSEDERCQITECNQVIKTGHDDIAAEVKEEILSEDERCQITECNQVIKTEHDDIAAEFHEDSIPEDFSIQSEVHHLKPVSNVCRRQNLDSSTHCEYNAGMKHILNRHISTVHRGEKSYSCAYCEYATTEQSNLKDHIASVHNGEKRFLCSFCGHLSAFKSSLERHVAAVHRRERPHACSFCSYSAFNKCHLKRHIARQHSK